MNTDLTTVFQLVLSFFACVGIVYLFSDIWCRLFKRCDVFSSVLTIDLTDEQNPVQKLMDFACFYHETGAKRYIKKIIVVSDSQEIEYYAEEICQALRLDIEVFKLK